MADKENKLILYKDEEGKVSVNTRFADEDVWLTQAQLAEIYNTTQQNISLHQKGIYTDGELEAEFQALEQNPMTMADWIAALDDQIRTKLIRPF